MIGKATSIKFEKIYTIVAQIPKGCVSTYGQLAFLAGFEQAPRLAGRALSYAPSHLPFHRVVNSVGRLAPGFMLQRSLLEEEGIHFKANGNVDIKKHLWNPFLDS